MDIEQIVKRQRDFFATGATLPVSARVDALKRLQANIRAAEKDLGVTKMPQWKKFVPLRTPHRLTDL